MTSKKILEKLNSISFNEKETEVIREYVGSSYELFSLQSMKEAEKLNPALINKRSLLERILKLDIDTAKYLPKDILEIFNSMMKKSSLPCSLKVYRGTSKAHFYATNIFNNDPNNYKIEVGSTYQSIVDQSTSLSLETAFEFTTKKNPLIIEYDLNKGFKGEYFGSVSFQKESEVLLMKNQLFKIIKVGRIDKNGIIKEDQDYNYIHVRAIKRY